MIITLLKSLEPTQATRLVTSSVKLHLTFSTYHHEFSQFHRQCNLIIKKSLSSLLSRTYRYELTNDNHLQCA